MVGADVKYVMIELSRGQRLLNPTHSCLLFNDRRRTTSDQQDDLSKLLKIILFYLYFVINQQFQQKTPVENEINGNL